ncbi:MAG: acylneuraminate cytidylyltransferase [Eggerthellaceae bacterium]|nr:acylneuraminate cytidylyltransferase [Eggerthellaceae bacterium]
MNILAVIPARGGSKGIPRKNMRLMNGRPLIEYAISNALSSRLVTDVAVSSDSPEILAFASRFEGAEALDRDSGLAADAVTLDPVVYDATVRMEQLRATTYDAVVTLQPTSPLLTVATLDAALEEFASGKTDSLISVVNDPHLSWRESEDGSIAPAYEKRLNRQQLPPEYRETGAFLVARRQCVTPESRLGAAIGVFEVPAHEALDIDTTEDWIVSEAMLGRKRIAFRVDGYPELGMGHVFRCLTLAYDLVGHNVVFVCNAAHREGIDKLRASNFEVVEIEDDRTFFDWLSTAQVDIVVNDILDTAADYILAIHPHVKRIVSFEDLGQGARLANAVVNAIYEGASSLSNAYTGASYVCLRDEFFTVLPKAFSPAVERVLVMFGGTDPSDLSSRLYAFAQSYRENGGIATFDFVLGPGYQGASVVDDPEKGISVFQDVARVSDHMARADLAFCSQGRTTFELAAMGGPSIVLAQNEREQLHTFAQMENGFVNLGLGSAVSDDDIAKTFEWLVGAHSVRREMRNRMLANDLRSGIKRVRRIILGEAL